MRIWVWCLLLVSSYNNSNNNNHCYTVGASAPEPRPTSYDYTSMYSNFRPEGSAASNPIDYQFQLASSSSSSSSAVQNKKQSLKNDPQNETADNYNDNIAIPRTTLPEEEENEERIQIRKEYDDNRNDRNTRTPKATTTTSTMSARRDPVAIYRRSFSGKVKLTLASTIVGGSMGYFLDQSILHQQSPPIFTVLFTFCFLCMTNTRTNYGDWMSTLGLTFLMVWKKFTTVKQQYPTRTYIRPALYLLSAERKAFPPNTDNPWQYQPDDEKDPQFKMIPALVAMAFIGSICGSSIPLLPTWMGSMMGAVALAYTTTLNNSRGDLCRVMAMRCVALTMQTWAVQEDLQLASKSRVILLHILDKIMIFDRKHKVKDKIVSLLSLLYNKALQIQSDMNNSSNNNNNNNNDNDNNNDRRRPPQQQQQQRRFNPRDNDYDDTDNHRNDRNYEDDNRRMRYPNNSKNNNNNNDAYKRKNYSNDKEFPSRNDWNPNNSNHDMEQRRNDGENQSENNYPSSPRYQDDSR